jgi:hypothetical protein
VHIPGAYAFARPTQVRNPDRRSSPCGMPIPERPISPARRRALRASNNSVAVPSAPTLPRWSGHRMTRSCPNTACLPRISPGGKSFGSIPSRSRELWDSFLYHNDLPMVVRLIILLSSISSSLHGVVGSIHGCAIRRRVMMWITSGDRVSGEYSLYIERDEI